MVVYKFVLLHEGVQICIPCHAVYWTNNWSLAVHVCIFYYNMENNFTDEVAAAEIGRKCYKN